MDFLVKLDFVKHVRCLIKDRELLLMRMVFVPLVTLPNINAIRLIGIKGKKRFSRYAINIVSRTVDMMSLFPAVVVRMAVLLHIN